MALLPEGVTTESINNIKHRAKGHFFQPATMRFFNSRIIEGAVKGPKGACFITSEKYGPGHERRFTVRRQSQGGKKMDTVCAFQQYASSKMARKALPDCALGKEKC